MSFAEHLLTFVQYRLKRYNNLYDGLLLSDRAKYNETGVYACESCSTSLKRDFNSPPKRAIANGFVIGHLPETIEETKLKYYMQIRWEHAKLENKMSLGENTYLFHFDDKRLGKQWHSGYHFDKGTFGPEWREYCNLHRDQAINSFRIRQTFPRYCNMYVPESIWRVWRHSNFFYQPDSDTEEMYCDE